MKTKEIYTTGEVAKICKVAPRTVSKWFDAGKLKGYKLPGAGDRRIQKDNLINFLTEYKFPIPTELGGGTVDLTKERTLQDSLQNLTNYGMSKEYEVEYLKGDCLAVAETCKTLMINQTKEPAL